MLFILEQSNSLMSPRASTWTRATAAKRSMLAKRCILTKANNTKNEAVNDEAGMPSYRALPSMNEPLCNDKNLLYGLK